MKKIYYLLLMLIIFNFINTETSLSSNSESTSKKTIEFYYNKSKKLFEEIIAADVCNKDAEAYTCLVQLKVRTYDYHFAKEQTYSSEYQRKTKSLYDEAKTNAEKISSTEDPNIYNALQVVLAYSKQLIES